MGDFNTYWRMTINNPDERDYALVKQGYPDDIRKIIWTPEEGENGTPHIQAYIQMKRSVRLSHMKKLFPGANFGTSTSAEWRLNQHNYPQKDDETTRGPHVIQNNDPLHTIEGTLRRVVERMVSEDGDSEPDLDLSRRRVEKAMVVEDYTMAKVFVSSTYKTMWKDFGVEIYECLFAKWQEAQVPGKVRVENSDTHTHTHAEKIFSREGGITDEDGKDSEGGEDDADLSEGEEDAEGEGDEDSGSEADEGYGESSSDQSDEEDVTSDDGE